MAENGEESWPIPPVEIRIRKGSDAPSLGEGKIASGAPMASFELSDIEDSDVEHHSDTGEEVFARSDSPNLGIPGKIIQRHDDESPEEEGTGAYETLGDDTDDLPALGTPKTPTPTPNLSSNKLTAMDDEVLDLTERKLDPDEELELERVEEQYEEFGKEDDEDRSVTPTNQAETDEISDAKEKLPLDGGGKIKINLPGSQFKHKHKKHKEQHEDDNSKISGPPRPPPPGKTGAPPRPAPPTAATTPPSGPTGWVTFDVEEKVEKIGPPPRPAAPTPKRPPQPKRPPPPSKAGGADQNKIKGESLDGNDESFNEESQLCVGDKEKKKSKIFSAKKITKFVDTKKLKPGKKEKKEKREVSEEELAAKFEKPAEEKTAEWEAFQKLLNKSAHATEKVKVMESGFEDELAKLEATSASNSPWSTITSGPGQPQVLLSPTDSQSSGSEVKRDWVGFDDNFDVTPNIASGQHLAHLNVTPVPSPAHAPLPPNNSARGSQEDLSIQPPAEVDLLGITSYAGASGTTQPSEVDFLGLDSADSENVPYASNITISDDILALSRNPIESNRSSQNASPTTDENGIDQSNALAFGLVDEFLGIDSNALPKPKDPLEELLKKASSKDEVKDSEDKEETANEFGVGSAITLGDDADDPFGLGTKSSYTSAVAGGDLFILGVGEEPEVGSSTIVETSENIASDDFEFDPRADINVDKLGVSAASDKPVVNIKATARPRPKAAAAKSVNPFKIALITREDDLLYTADDLEQEDITQEDIDTVSKNPFTAGGEMTFSATNPFADVVTGETGIPFVDGQEAGELDIFAENVSAAEAVSGSFNPFATITEGEPPHASGDDNFDPFQTIHGDDAFEVHFPQPGQASEEGGAVSPPRFNPFNKEPPLDAKFGSFEPQSKAGTSEDEGKSTPRQITSSEASIEEEEELEPLAPFYENFAEEGWSMLLRQPTKKKLTQNRYWKPVYIRLQMHNGVPTIRVYNDEKNPDCMQELPLQPSYNLCNLGLQQYDQFSKCHTLKIQYIFYKERVGVKAERIAPTLGDLARVRDLKGLKDLVHRPKTTMLLDHAPQTSELLKLGGFEYPEFRSFIREVEDALFHLECQRDKTQEYTKDEITVDIVDEYFAEFDRDGHMVFHKARVRVFCLAFLTGTSMVEVGINDRRRKGKEVVGRRDIIPIKTEEWVRIEDSEVHAVVDKDVLEKTKVLKFAPLDACQFEVMRFRCRPRMNKELSLQIRVQMSVVDRHVEIRSDIIIPGYYSNSRKASQTPCEDIMIRFPIPEPWIYLFRVEKRFKYGSVKSTTRKPGKIKGLERLTQMAQGFLPPSLIEVSTGAAKYENVFHGIVWRIPRLPERNQGAYKTHLFTLKVDLGPHDVIPETYEKHIDVEYNMPNSMVSRAQVRSISVQSTADDPPDRWVHHLAKYEYKVEIEFTDKPKAPLQDVVECPVTPETPRAAPPEPEEAPVLTAESDSDSSDDSDSD